MIKLEKFLRSRFASALIAVLIGFAIAAIVPLALYDGKKGKRLPKYAGYIFYPAHLAVILVIRLLFY